MSICSNTFIAQRITFVPGPDSGPVDNVDDPVQPVSHAFAAPFSAVQANRALMRGCCAILAVRTDINRCTNCC